MNTMRKSMVHSDNKYYLEVDIFSLSKLSTYRSYLLKIATEDDTSDLVLNNN